MRPVAEDGAYQIDRVPSGNYVLEVLDLTDGPHAPRSLLRQVTTINAGQPLTLYLAP